jgi:hypothetical protein
MSNRILSYTNLIADDTIDRILLTTKKGEVGYRIIKFETIYQNPAGLNAEGVMKIYSEEQTSTDATIDFSDQRLLAAAFIENNNSNTYFGGQTIVLSNKIINQDIYITFEDNGANHACNYYLELETIKLDESQAMVATLKDIRNNS